MYSLGETSKKNLSTCCVELQQITDIAITLSVIDFTVVEGHRGRERQNELYHALPPKTKVMWPHSKHNTLPSEAADIVPYVNGKLSWNYYHCCYLAGVIMAVASFVGVGIRWGGDWNRNGEPITDQDFQDLAHYEIIKKEKKNGDD